MTAEASRAGEESNRAALVGVVHSTQWLREILQTVRELGPPGAYVAAGIVRDTVWDALTGRRSAGAQGDVDVVYWAAAEREGGGPGVHERRLRAARPDLDWEVTNQATVHQWHWEARGQLIAPHPSVEAGVATWPETATAVALRLQHDERVEVLAPLGLADLFALRLRHNPAQVGVDVFCRRVADKRWLQRWPELTLVGSSKE
jgi:hypothetical protein